MSSQYCPQCGTPRLGAFRFCRSCQFDFDAESQFTSSDTPASQPSPGLPSTSPGLPPTAIHAPVTEVAPAVAAGPALAGGFRWTKRRVLVGSVVALIALGSIGNAIGSPAAPSTTGSPAPSVRPFAAATAGAASSAPAAVNPSVTASPTPAVTPAPTPESTPAPTAAPITYAKLSSRAWSQLVKAPDNYAGKGYLVWACVTQFDAATGTDSFRAQGSYKDQEYWYTDGDNALFSGTTAQLADFVQDDVVYMKVLSLGSFSYDTQIGGNTTVPLFEVVSISRKGSCA